MSPGPAQYGPSFASMGSMFNSQMNPPYQISGTNNFYSNVGSIKIVKVYKKLNKSRSHHKSSHRKSKKNIA